MTQTWKWSFLLRAARFREGDPGGWATVEEEIAHFLFGLGVDGLFTSNPDLFRKSLGKKLEVRSEVVC